MKIKKLTKGQIGKWIEKNVPDDLTLFDFTKGFQDFQDAIEKANRTRRQVVKSIKCDGCGKVHDADSIKLLDIQFYVTPHGCTGGDYWEHKEYAVHCKGCGHMLTIRDDVPWGKSLTQEKVYPTNNHGFSHRDCTIKYKYLYQ
jgi:hypothetical protein